MSKAQPSIQMIPLNRLVPSPRNVRRVNKKVDIDALAASIASRGLLQNLCVVAAEDDTFEVDAGGRRLAALKKLARDKVIPKNHPVPCQVVELEAGREVSLVENIQRVGMDAMDEVDAYAALIVDGSTQDSIAQRFGVTRRHVDQRLALAGLSPKIKAAWKRGDVSLEAARAFCLVEDHAQQDAVFRSLGRPVTHAASVRARLMDGRMRASDCLAVFVGLDAYEAAGGKVVRDLFDEDAVFIEDPALLTRLAEEALSAVCGQWLAEGWCWAEVNLRGGRSDGLSPTRLHPEWRDPTADEQAELDRLSAEIDALDAELETNSEEDDARWSKRDDLEAAFETIRQAGRRWTEEQKSLAGVVLSLNQAGEVQVIEGMVRSVDQKRVDAFLKSGRSWDGELDSDEPDTDGATDEPHTSLLPKVVNRELTLARTRAIRLALSADPDVALAVCVSALAQRAVRHGEMTGIAISSQTRPVEDLPALDAARSELEGRLPSEEASVLDWTLDLSRERLLGVLALLVAGAVDLAHDDVSQLDLRKQELADRLAQQLDIDMRQFWKPDLAFWVRLPKATLMTTLAEAPTVAERSARSRDALIKAHAKLRKDDLAAKVCGLFEGTGYLPGILVTPVAAGRLSVTVEGEAALAPLVAVAG